MPKSPPDLDRIFFALADPTRRGILERLSHGPAAVGELAHPLPMSLPSVMQHIGILEAEGLVRSKKVGRVRMCSLQPDTLRDAEQWLGAQRAEWEHRLDRLGDYLSTLGNQGEARGADDQTR
jgi:DNA-binding transcriptional ArsR family regulator